MMVLLGNTLRGQQERGVFTTAQRVSVSSDIVSEWSQILSLVWFTKYLIQRGSKQSHD